MPPYRRKPLQKEHLTPTELRILRALTSDDTSGQAIAEGLGMTYYTQATHRKRLYAKLGAHTAAQAIAAGRLAGLIP